MLIFLHGQDSFRSMEKLKILKHRFIKEVDKSGLNLAQIDAEDKSIDELNKAIASQSFLAKKRMVVVKNVFKQTKHYQEQVLDILKKGKFRNGQQSNVVIFWDEKVDKKSALYKYLNGSKVKEEFNILDSQNLTKWVVQRVKNKGSDIDSRRAAMLSSKSDGNLWALANEIDKLVAVKQGKRIEEADIESSTLFKLDDNIFNLTDAIANQDKQRALKLLEDQLDSGVNALYLLTMMIRQFRIIVQVKDALEHISGDHREIAKSLDLHPFVVKKSLPQAAKYNKSELKKIYERLFHIDGELKKGAEARLYLEMFVMSL